MKRHFRFGILIVATLVFGSARLPLNAQVEPLSLQSLAETICGEGQPFPTSELFNLFELEVPFLMLTDGPEMMATPAPQCQNFRPVEIEQFYLVLGHRSAKGTATFYVTSLRGELIEAARGFKSNTGDTNFVGVEPTNEIRADFEAAKAFWLEWSSPMP